MRRVPLLLTVATGVVALLGTVVVSLPAAAQQDGFPIRASVRTTPDPTPALRIDGRGWGHGVGMSQYGAYAMSRAGHDVADILGHYYPGTQLSTADATRPIRVGLRQGVTSTWVEAVDRVRWDGCPATDGRRTPDGDCEQRIATQEPGDGRWHVCPVTVPATDPGASAVPGLRVQTVACDTTPTTAQTVVTTDHPSIRVHHSSTINTFDIRTPGPQGSTYHRGTHDIFHVTGARVTTVQNLRSVEEYLYGLAEVPRSWGNAGGTAALHAQVVTGRTFALRKLAAPRGGACRCDLLATPADQAYAGSLPERDNPGHWVAAVDDTAGQVLTHPSEPSGLAQTYYSSSHGGRTENSEDSWAYSAAVPYLRSVDDPWSLTAGIGNSFRSWRATARNADVAARVSETAAGSVQVVERLQIVSRTAGGSPKVVRVTGRTAAGQRVSFDYGGVATSGAGARMRYPGFPVTSIVRVDGSTTPLTRIPGAQIRRLSWGPFDDDDGTSHEYATVWAVEAGIANGTSATTYAPTRALQRGQMASLLVATFQIPAASDPHGFEDVADDNAHRDAIAALAESGITSGTSATTFGPSEPVTRAQMATFLAKAAGWDRTGTPEFSDVSASNTHAGAIAAIADEGVTSGCGGDRYCPDEAVSRGQMASFLYRLVRG